MQTNKKKRDKLLTMYNKYRKMNLIIIYYYYYYSTFTEDS